MISPEASLYEGDATSVVVPAFDGEIGILTGHAPMMTLLGKGALRIEGAGGARRFHGPNGTAGAVETPHPAKSGLVEGLHAQADPVHARRAQARPVGHLPLARIRLECDLPRACGCPSLPRLARAPQL